MPPPTSPPSALLGPKRWLRPFCGRYVTPRRWAACRVWRRNNLLSGFRLVGDAVDLDLHLRIGKSGLDRGARRFVIAEEFGVNLIHRGEVFAVGKKNGTLYNVLHGRAAALQNRLDVAKHETGFVLDIAVRHLLRGRVDRALARSRHAIA